MTRKLLPVLLVLLAGCGPSADPADAPRPITPLTLEPPPIYALLGYREQLSLESEQISALDSLAQEVQDRNAPLVDSLQRAGGWGRQGRLTVNAQTEPLLERIRENNRRVVEEVGEVLTPEQRSTTCRLFRETRNRRMEQRAPGRRAPSVPDSVAAGMGGLVWTWCD